MGAARSLGYALIGQGRYEAAASAFSRVAEAGGPEVLADLCSVYRLLERYDEAIDVGKASLEEQGGSRPHLVYAGLLLEIASYDEALAESERAIALDPAAADAWFTKGMALEQVANDLAGARAAYDRALGIDARHYSALMARADVRRELGDGGSADDYERSLTEIREGHADDPDATAVAGWCLLGLGRYEEAVSRFLAALAAAPRLAYVNFDLGLAMLLRGQLSPATRQYEKGLDEIRSKHPLHQRGLLSVAKRDLDRERAINEDLAGAQDTTDAIADRLDTAIAGLAPGEPAQGG